MNPDTAVPIGAAHGVLHQVGWALWSQTEGRDRCGGTGTVHIKLDKTRLACPETVSQLGEGRPSPGLH